MPTPEADLVAATLAPAFLVSGSAVFLNFVQNRLFRVVDRLRSGELAHDEEERTRFARRARILRNAIVLGVIAITFTMLTAIGLFLTALYFPAQGGLVLASFGLGMLALVGAAMCAVWDTVLSVRSAAGR